MVRQNRIRSEAARQMQDYWDDAAQRNPFWYVDTSLSYEQPDLDQFWKTGLTVADQLYTNAPVQPDRTELAVEIGSGVGRICKALSTHFDRVVGVDISPTMIAAATEYVPDPRVSFVLGGGSGIDGVDTASADLVASFTVFQHIPRIGLIESYIADAGRVLRPGGVFAFQWNNLPHGRRWAVRRELLSLLQRVGLGREHHGRNAPQFLGSRVTLERITSSVERAGMTLEATEGLGTLYAWAWARKR